jgi:hypothetical protein
MQTDATLSRAFRPLPCDAEMTVEGAVVAGSEAAAGEEEDAPPGLQFDLAPEIVFLPKEGKVLDMKLRMMLPRSPPPSSRSLPLWI